MNQIWTNPSLQRSLVLTNGTTSDLIYCLKLSQKDSTSDTVKDTIIFPNMEYNITFYDASSGRLYSITGMVVDVFEDQIKVKYIANNSSKNCRSNTYSNNTTGGMPNCSCILNPPDLSKYEGPSIIFIPIMNIVSVSYVLTRNDKNNNGGLYVMLLGISATTLKAIIIRMAFFEDNIEEAVKYVDLKAGGIYDLTYESATDSAIYESRVKVMSIEEADDRVPCKPGKGYVREHIGNGNSVYTNCCCNKDEFMTNPPVKKIRIIVDTSENFAGRYESIMLDAIRDCVLVYDPSNETGDDTTTDNYCDCCNYKTSNCNPNCCGHYIPVVTPNNCCDCNTAPQTYVYKYENMYKAAVTGDRVAITANGETTEIDLDTLLKYYLGID